jgi:hypothetical protein
MITYDKDLKGKTLDFMVMIFFENVVLIWFL